MKNKVTSLWHCLWALPIILVTIGTFVFILFSDLSHVTDSLTQVVVPGQVELTLSANTQYTVFLEEQSVVNGEIFSTSDSISGLVCQVSSPANNQQVSIRQADRDTTYSLNQRSGHSVLEFTTAEAGKYKFACDYKGTNDKPRVVLAVGTGVGKGIVFAIGKSFVTIFGGIFLSLLIVVLVVVKHTRDKRKLWQAQQPPPTPGAGF